MLKETIEAHKVKDLKVGDKIYVFNKVYTEFYFRSTKTVSAITKTLVKFSDVTQLKKKDLFFVEANKENKKMILDEVSRSQLATATAWKSNDDMKKLSLQELRTIAEIFKKNNI